MTDRRLALAGLALLATACGGADAGTARSVVRDSAGIAIVENASPDDSAAYDWWRLGETLLDIGGEDAGHDLFRVSGAIRRGDGTVIVANGGTSELRVFDAAGTLMATAGRRGDGPGEFQSIAWLAFGTADSLLVYDGRANRITVLGPDGTFGHDFLFGGTGTPASPVGRFGNGEFAARLSIMIGAGANAPPPQGLQRPDVAIVRIDPAGGVIDTVGRFPGAERVIRIAGAGGQITGVEITTPLFGRTPYHVVSGEELVSATQDDPELKVYGTDGALRRIIRTGRVPEPITDAHRNALIERRLAAAPEEARPRIREGLEALPAEGTIPPYAALVPGLDGTLWLADWNDGLGPAGRWTVYSADGRGLARIALPERFTPFDIGADWMLGRELDELDIEHVRLYRFARS